MSICRQLMETFEGKCGDRYTIFFTLFRYNSSDVFLTCKTVPIFMTGSTDELHEYHDAAVTMSTTSSEFRTTCRHYLPPALFLPSRRHQGTRFSLGIHVPFARVFVLSGSLGQIQFKRGTICLARGTFSSHVARSVHTWHVLFTRDTFSLHVARSVYTWHVQFTRGTICWHVARLS